MPAQWPGPGTRRPLSAPVTVTAAAIPSHVTVATRTCRICGPGGRLRVAGTWCVHWDARQPETGLLCATQGTGSLRSGHCQFKQAEIRVVFHWQAAGSMRELRESW